MNSISKYRHDIQGCNIQFNSIFDQSIIWLDFWIAVDWSRNNFKYGEYAVAVYLLAISSASWKLECNNRCRGCQHFILITSISLIKTLNQMFDCNPAEIVAAPAIYIC